MSYRTLGLVGSSLLLAALAALQVLRLAERDDRAGAVLEGILLFGIAAVAVVGVLVAHEIAMRRRRNSAAELAPPGYELVALGHYDHVDQTNTRSNRRASLFIGHGNIKIMSLSGADESNELDTISLSELQAVTQFNMDHPSSWETGLALELSGGGTGLLTLDGWRFRSRKRMSHLADLAIARIESEKSTWSARPS